MQTRREYLVGLGLAKEGRGKLSNAAHEALDEAIKGGMQFSDLQEKPVVVKREKKDRETSQPEGDNRFADARIFVPIDTRYKGTDSQGKSHTINARAICYNSGYSIAGCGCSNHRSLVGSLEIIPVIQGG